MRGLFILEFRMQDIKMKTMPLEMITVLFVTGASLLASGIINPITPLYLAEVELSARLIGLIFSVNILAIFLSEFPSGWMFDKVSPKLGLLAGTVVQGFAIGAILLAKSVPGYFAVFFVSGLFWTPAFLASRWYMGVFTPSGSKAASLGLITLVIAGSNGVGSVLGGWLADAYGLKFPFYAAAGLLVLLGVVIILAFRRLDFTKPSQILTESSDEPLRETPQLFVWGSIIQLGLLASVIFIGFSIMSVYLPLLSEGVFNSTPGQIGLLFGVFGLVRFITAIPLSRMADKRGRRRFVLLGLLSCAAAFIGFTLAPNYGWALVSMIFYSLALVLFNPAAGALISEMVSKDQQGRAMGILGAFEDGGAALGPAIGGVLWETRGVRFPFIFAAVTAVLGAASWLVWGVRKRVALPSSARDSGVTQSRDAKSADK
jgi:MFS family permease